MDKIMIQMPGGNFMYATSSDDKFPLSKDNIGFSIYPHRALDVKYLDVVTLALPSFTFKLGK